MWSGLAQAAPVVMGYVPIGLAYGVLAQKAGISTLNTLLMSLIVYAGSSQLIAVGLFAAGASALSVVATTFVVNLRHMLMAAALSPHLRAWRPIELAGFAFELTDETFGVHSARFASGAVRKREAFVVNMTAQASWLLGSWLGLTAGQLVGDVRALALDYALPPMFIALLVLQIRDRTQLLVAVASGVLGVALLYVGLGPWNVIVATVSGATIGVAVERWIKTRSP